MPHDIILAGRGRRVAVERRRSRVPARQPRSPRPKPADPTARPVDPKPFRPGPLAADVARHIWTERGRFSPALYETRRL